MTVHDTNNPETQHSPLWESQTIVAQAMVDEPWRAEEFDDSLNRQLTRHYGYEQTDHIPVKAVHAIAKKRRIVGMAALERYANDELQAAILPVWRDGTSFQAAAQPFWQVAGILALNDRHHAPDSLSSSIDTIYSWSVHGLRRLQHAAAQSEGHPYHSLFANVSNSNRACVKAEIELGAEPSPILDVLSDASRFVELPRAETASLVTASLVYAGLSNMESGNKADRESLAQYAAGRSKDLSAWTTVNKFGIRRTKSGELIRLFQSQELGGGFKHDIEAYSGMLAVEGWDIASLRRGSWPQPGCPAAMKLRSADDHTRSSAVELEDLYSQRYKLPTSGRPLLYDQSRYAINYLGIPIAEETFYDRWQKIMT